MTDEFKLPPALQAVVNRTRQVGLHKVAKTLTGCDATLPDIVQHMGRALFLHNQKYAHIHTGLSDLEVLADNNIVPLEKEAFMSAIKPLANKMMQGAGKAWQGLGNMGARAGTAVAQRPVMNRMGRVDQAIANMPGLSNAQRGAMTQQWLPHAEQAMTAAGNRGAQIGRNVAQGGALVAGGAALGAGLRGGGQPQQPQY